MINDKKKYNRIYFWLEVIFLLISAVSISFCVYNMMNNLSSIKAIIILAILCIGFSVSFGLILYLIDNYFYKRSIFFIKSVSIKDRKRCYCNDQYITTYYKYKTLQEIISLINSKSSIEPLCNITHGHQTLVTITNKVYGNYKIVLCMNKWAYLKIYDIDNPDIQIYLSPSESVKLERWLYLKMLRL